jgi:hydroxypyruvate reductase
MLRDDAIAIWNAAVHAVDSERLVRAVVTRTEQELFIAGHRFRLSELGRLLVVGGGKAGAGMAAGLEAALGDDLVDAKVTGLLNVPANCVRKLRQIVLHPGRPAGMNEPTAEGVAGVEQMLSLVRDMRPRDVCVVLLSGGGSALLPAPVEGISLADKQAVTRKLMQRGASIEELNLVRGCLSRIKRGGLVRAMPAGRCITLIISDVISDPLPVIASGPTVNEPADPADALRVLRRLVPARGDLPESVWTVLERSAQQPARPSPLRVTVHHHVIGNNHTALQAALREAQRRGYRLAGMDTDQRGLARDVGSALADRCLALRNQPCPPPGWCWLSGGEPVVELVDTPVPRLGGRNQEVVLAAVERLMEQGCEGIALLSGGTDGEDGPTDAAGAFADAKVCRRAHELKLKPAEFLAINNSYPFFAATGGLLRTGPTHTNVMDVRVALVAPP